MIRGIAALFVVLSHFSSANKGFLYNIMASASGQFGVMLFFVLSGYLMSTIYLSKEANPSNIKKFVIARVARIFPLYFIVVIVSYLFQFFKLPFRDILFPIVSKSELLLNLLFIQGTSVLWTIPKEIQFYFIFVLLWWIFSRYKGYGNFVVLLLAVFAMFFTSIQPTIHIFKTSVEVNLINISILYFLTGTMMGQIKNLKWTVPDYLRKNYFVIVLFLLPLFFTQNTNRILGIKTPSSYVIWNDMRILFIIAATFFILVFVVPDNNPIVSNRFGDFLGNISYSLYLLHYPIMLLLQRYLIHDFGVWPKFVITLSTDFILAYASYKLLEIPSKNLTRALFKQSD